MTKMTTLTKPTAQPHGIVAEVDQDAEVLRLEIPYGSKAVDAAPVSKGGKCRLLASTRGALEVPGTEITLSINAMVPLA